MKKPICLILSIIIMMSFVACGQKKEDPVEKNVSGTTAGSSVSTEEKQEKINDNSNLPRKYQIPMENIYINAPAWQELEKGFSEVFIVQEEKYVAITYSTDTLNDLKEVHDTNTNSLILGTKNFYMPNELIVESDSTVNVNGIDMYRFEGHFACGKDHPYDAYAIGYDFIMDNIPVSVCGCVINREQPEDVKAEIKSTVEAMMATLRNKE